jgi:hypothetical protein
MKKIIIYLIFLMSIKSCHAVIDPATVVGFLSTSWSYLYSCIPSGAQAYEVGKIAVDAIKANPVPVGVGVVTSSVAVGIHMDSKSVEKEKLAMQKKQTQIKQQLIKCLQRDPLKTIKERKKDCPQEISDFLAYVSHDGLPQFIAALEN